MTTSISTGWGELSTSLASPSGVDEEDEGEFSLTDASSSSNMQSSLAVSSFRLLLSNEIAWSVLCAF